MLLGTLLGMLLVKPGKGKLGRAGGLTTRYGTEYEIVAAYCIALNIHIYNH